MGAPPTFLEGVGGKHRMRSGCLTPSRKVGQRPQPLLAFALNYIRASRAYFRVGAPPTFLEGVGGKHRMRSGRLTPSRKVGQRPQPLLAMNYTHASRASVGAPPTFLEGVGGKHRGPRRSTPSRKVVQRTPP